MTEESEVSPAPPPPPAPPSQKVGTEQRQALLAQTIASQVAGGARVESQGPFSAILVRGKPVNNVLQLILTLITAGIWLFVWIPLLLLGGEKRSQVGVDEFGNVTVQKLG
jgi:hypothetical protein